MSDQTENNNIDNAGKALPVAGQEHGWIEVICAWDNKRRLMKLDDPTIKPRYPLALASGAVEIDGEGIHGKAQLFTPNGTPVFFSMTKDMGGTGGETKAVA